MSCLVVRAAQKGAGKNGRWWLDVNEAGTSAWVASGLTRGEGGVDSLEDTPWNLETQLVVSRVVLIALQRTGKIRSDSDALFTLFAFHFVGS